MKSDEVLNKLEDDDYCLICEESDRKLETKGFKDGVCSASIGIGKGYCTLERGHKGQHHAGYAMFCEIGKCRIRW